MYYRFNTWRFALVLLCAVGILFLPWWVPAVCAIALCLRFRAWEVVLLGMFADLYWMPGFIAASWGGLPWATIYAVCIFFVFEPLRRQLLVGPEIL